MTRFNIPLSRSLTGLHFVCTAMLAAWVSWLAPLQGPAQASEQASSAALAPKAPSTYVAIVDAGSSGSRIHLYALERPAGQLIIADLLDVSSNAPALSAYADMPEAAGARGMAQLIAALDQRLAELAIGKDQVAVHVLATAGMRLVTPERTKPIYDEVRRTFQAAQYTVARIETLSGEMEGFYAWADVNFLAGAFQSNKELFGIVEIGGASAQVTYSAEKLNDRDVVRARILGRDYSVKSASFLGLGVNEAHKGMMAGSDKGTSCHPAGSLIEHMATARFDMSSCMAAYRPLIGATHIADFQNRMDFRHQQFIGVGRPLSGSLALWKIAEPYPAKMAAKAATECPRGWNHIAATYGASRFTQDLCANSAFFTAFLFGPTGLGLREDRIIVEERIGGRVPNWPRGVAVSLARD